MSKGSLCILCVLILTFPNICTSVSASGENSYLMIEAVYPTSTSEGVALRNYGSYDIDLKGYSLYDGEGTVSFSESIVIHPSETVYLLKGTAPDWLNGLRSYVYGENGIQCKNFILNDSGDDIYLKKGDSVIDSFVYGNGKCIDDSWKGQPLEKISKNKIAHRISYFDTDTSEDWSIISVGYEEIQAPDGYYQSKITPFIFPESKGSELLWALYNAEISVDISVYLINHPDIISILRTLLDEGVGIRILIEGAPAGGINESELGYLSLLNDHGAEVKLIRSGDYGKRYEYLHNKYVVIDGNKTVITSENWQVSSFESNIGWGAIIESEEYASFMENVFETDFCGLDTFYFTSVYNNVRSESVDDYLPSEPSALSYDCSVFPVLSPDYSWEAMKEFISGADNRLYIQQLEIDYDWTVSDDNPLKWALDRAETGTDCRLILDGTFDDADDVYIDDSYGVVSYLKDTSLKAKINDTDSLLHNKGLIADDSVWLGSVNWTSTSFNDNRETAVIIYSSEVSDYYASYFNVYWGEYYGTAEITVDYDKEVVSGSTILLDASGSRVGSDAVFCWDLDGDGITDRTGKRVPVIFDTGLHEITLTVRCDEDEYTEMIEILAVDHPSETDIPWKYVPFIIICVIFIGRYVFSRFNACKGIQKEGRCRRL